MIKMTTGPFTLLEFLRLPECKPALEFIGGRLIQKMPPRLSHSVIQGGLLLALDAFARPRKLGRAYPELRAVYGGVARVPDLSFYATERIPRYVPGDDEGDVLIAPDLVVEIRSPGQSVAELRVKIRLSLKHGSKLGWLIDPPRRRIHVIRKGQKSRILKIGHDLDGEDVLPAFSLPLEELFGWLTQN